MKTKIRTKAVKVVVKIQRSLFDSDAKSTILMYDQKRDHMIMTELTPEYASWFKEGEVKFFGEVQISEDPPAVKLLRRVESQGW